MGGGNCRPLNNKRKIMKKAVFFVVLSIVLFAACGDDDESLEDGAPNSANMVDYYVDCDNIILTAIGSTIKVRFEGEPLTRGKNSEKFFAVAKSNNDTSYNRKLLPARYASINDSLSKISIVCDKEFNSEYLAGTELSSLFTFRGETVYNIIQNNYSSYSAEHIVIPANAVSFSQTRIIAPEFELVLNTPPAQSGIYTFDVSITLSKKTLTGTVKMEF